MPSPTMELVVKEAICIQESLHFNCDGGYDEPDCWITMLRGGVQAMLTWLHRRLDSQYECTMWEDVHWQALIQLLFRSSMT